MKTLLVESMLIDANDFIWRADILLKNPSHLTSSYISKVYIDYLFSIETSLKSLIMSLSKLSEKPEDIYIAARMHGHKIMELYNEVEKRAKGRKKLLSTKDKKVLTTGATIDVNYRYYLTTLLKLKEETSLERILRTGKIRTLLTHEFITDLRLMAFNLRKIAEEARKKYMDDRAYVLSNEDKISKRLETFITTLKSARKL